MPNRRGDRRSLRLRLAAGLTACSLFAGLTMHGAADAHAAPTRTPPTSSAPAAPTAPGATRCVGAESATLGKVFETVFDSMAPSLPLGGRASAAATKRRVLADLRRMTISSLAVSTHPAGLGASPDAPVNTYRDPVSQWIVTQLMNVRSGQAAKPIRVAELTMSQAVETAWFYFYVTTVVPLTVVKETLPGFYSIGPVSIGTLITLPISIGTSGMKALYSSISDKIIGKCLVRMTPEEIRRAGRPAPSARATAAIPQAVRDIAAQVAIAEPGTCPAVADLPLKRIVARTAAYLQATAPDRATAKRIEAKHRKLQRFMRTVRVPHHWMPADPADFTAVEKLLSMGLGMAPTVGGALTDVLVGIGHNAGRGHDLTETVPFGDVTITKTVTAAYFAYAVTTQFVSAVTGMGASAVATALGGIDVLPKIGGVINVPNTYGLVVYHNALRSLCLAEDRKAPARSAKPRAIW